MTASSVLYVITFVPCHLRTYKLECRESAAQMWSVTFGFHWQILVSGTTGNTVSIDCIIGISSEDLLLRGMYSFERMRLFPSLSQPKVFSVKSSLYTATESKEASPRKILGLIRGYLLKKSFKVGIRSFASWTDLSSSGESAFLFTAILGWNPESLYCKRRYAW